MTKEGIGRLAIELIQEEIKGKQIQYSIKGINEWVNISIIQRHGVTDIPCTNYDFRIKPEKKLVPFTWEDRELLRGKWFLKKTDLSTGKNAEYALTRIYFDEVHFGQSKYNYYDLMQYFTFLDGSPCGKEVEE